MQDRLAVQTDQCDAVAGNREFFHKGENRLDMRISHRALQRVERAARGARIGDDVLKRALHFSGIGKCAARTGFDMRLAVARDKRDVNAVHRGSTDDADGAEERRGAFHCDSPIVTFSSPTPAIDPSSTSPGATGPTPAGVPVKMRSPGAR